MKNLQLKEMILCALFVALIAVGAWIRIPVGTDIFTLQFLFTLLAGLLLGARLGALSVAVYMILGLLGVPVFAQGGGLSYLLQPTFGYLPGFMLQAALGGYLSRKLSEVSLLRLLGINLCGMGIVYVLGIGYYYVISNFVIQAPIAWWTLLWYGGILQAPADILLCTAAAFLSLRCYRLGIWLDPEERMDKIPAKEG